jgi:repressor LexA
MSNEKPLSPRQQNILQYIQLYLEENSRPPTIREIGSATNISSTSVVNYNLTKLTERGLLERDAEVSRGLKLTDVALELLGAVVETVKETVAYISDAFVRVPLVGTIAAGRPIDLPNTDYGQYDDEDLINLSTSMLPGKVEDELFALKVKGNSMIDAMVNSGDIVIMRQQPTAENGDMVAVWLKDEDTTTLKYFYNEGARVRLQPANPEMDPIFVDAGNVEVQGKVMMVLRQMS